MKFMVNSRLASGTNNKEKGVQCVIETPKGKETLDADVCLLSIGRRPFTGGLQVEKAGLELNKWGKIDINSTW